MDDELLLSTYDVPLKMRDSIALQKKLESLDKNNVGEIFEYISENYSSDGMNEELVSNICFYEKLRFLNSKEYCLLLMLFHEKYQTADFKDLLVIKSSGRLKRELYLRKFFNISEVMDMVYRDESLVYYFIPELGFKAVKSQVSIYSSFIGDDINFLVHHNYKHYKEYLEHGYLLNSIQYYMKYDMIDKFIIVYSDYSNDKFDTSPFEDPSDVSTLNMLDFSVRYSSLNIFKFLTNKGFKMSSSTLCEAIRSGSVEIFSLVYPNVEDCSKVLEYATKYHRDNIFDWIISNVTYVEPPTFFDTVLHQNYNVSMFYLVKNGLIDSKNVLYQTPLHIACQQGSFSLIDVLLESGARVDALDKLNRTPLHEASYYGNIQCLIPLIERKPNLDMRDDSGKTALHYACMRGCIQAAWFLIDNGADINCVDFSLQTPLHLASQFNYPRMVEFLIWMGAEKDPRDKVKKTPLYRASREGYYDVCLILYKNGANPNIKDSFSNTPFTIAKNHDIRSIFLDTAISA